MVDDGHAIFATASGRRAGLWQSRPRFLNDNQFDRAIADFNAVVRLNPNLAAAYYNRSLAKEKNGDMVGAARI